MRTEQKTTQVTEVTEPKKHNHDIVHTAGTGHANKSNNDSREGYVTLKVNKVKIIRGDLIPTRDKNYSSAQSHI